MLLPWLRRNCAAPRHLEASAELGLVGGAGDDQRADAVAEGGHVEGHAHLPPTRRHDARSFTRTSYSRSPCCGVNHLQDLGGTRMRGLAGSRCMIAREGRTTGSKPSSLGYRSSGLSVPDVMITLGHSDGARDGG